MIREILIDFIVSNLIVFISYSLTSLLWLYFFYNLEHEINFLLLNLPYGIIILAFLFFGNKIIFGILLSQISLYFMFENYNLDLPLNNFFIISTCQLACLPITLFILKKCNVTVGAGENFKFDKTNIFHVSFIAFYSTILLGIIITFSSLFFYNQTNLFTFTLGNLFGGVIFIVSLKILINIPKSLKSLIRIN